MSAYFTQHSCQCADIDFVVFQLDDLMTALRAMKNDRLAKKMAEKKKRVKTHQAMMKELEIKKLASHREAKKRLYKMMPTAKK